MTTDNPASNQHRQIGASPEQAGAAYDTLPHTPVPHAHKFRVAVGALIGIAVAALAIAVVVATRSSNSRTLAGDAHWSSWAPDTGGSIGVSEIAQHVAPYYRLSAADQLDLVTPVSVAQETAAGTTTGSGPLVVLNRSAGKGQSLALLGGKTVAYNLCGIGTRNCELGGTPSIARLLLLRREALELALYTFRYIGDARNVIAVLPPAHPPKSTGVSSSSSPVPVVVVFLRGELQPWLNVPLSRTLQQYPLAVAELHLWRQTAEAGFVDQVTAHSLFSAQIEASQLGGNLLVLNQLPAQ